MSRNRFTEEFKRDAVAQVIDRGYAVSEVAERLGTPLTGRRLHSNRREGAQSRSTHGKRGYPSQPKMSGLIQGKPARYGG